MPLSEALSIIQTKTLNATVKPALNVAKINLIFFVASLCKKMPPA